MLLSKHAIHSPAEIKVCLDVPDNSNYLDKERKLDKLIGQMEKKNTYRWLEAPKIPCGAMTAKSANDTFMNLIRKGKQLKFALEQL